MPLQKLSCILPPSQASRNPSFVYKLKWIHWTRHNKKMSQKMWMGCYSFQYYLQ